MNARARLYGSVASKGAFWGLLRGTRGLSYLGVTAIISCPSAYAQQATTESAVGSNSTDLDQDGGITTNAVGGGGDDGGDSGGGTTTPTVAADIVPPPVYTTTPTGVSLADGSFLYSNIDLSMGGLELQRFHRTGLTQPNDPMFGKNFSSNFDIYAEAKLNSNGTVYYINFHIGNSSFGRYSRAATSSAVSPTSMSAEAGSATWNGSQYTFTNTAGDVYTFSSTVTGSVATQKKIQQIDFVDGRRQTFSYDSTGFLKLVDDTSGFAIVFDKVNTNDVSNACIFNRSATYVSAASTCTGAAMKVSYAYATSPAGLASFTDVMGNATTYENANAGITCIKPPGYASCKMSFTYSGDRVLNQTLLDGGTWSTTGMNSAFVKNDEFYIDGTPNEAGSTDPAGNQTSAVFVKTSLSGYSDPLGRGSTYVYVGNRPYLQVNNGLPDHGAYLKSATYPGNSGQYLAEYLGPYNAISKETRVAKSGSGLPDLVKLYGYPSSGTIAQRTKPISITDAKGFQTNYTYASFGGILSEMPPAAVSGAARPLKLTTWTQRYASVKNSAGSLVQAATPIWVKATETQCQTVAGTSPAASCDATATQTVTTYEYGTTGTNEALLVKGIAVSSGGVTLRTCYRYDQYARKISETKPNANLATCP